MFWLPKRDEKETKNPPSTIKDAYMGRACDMMPVEVKRNDEDGFMYEVPRPIHTMVMVTLLDGSRYFRDGDQELLNAVEKAGEIYVCGGGWTQFPYSEYGSPAWEREVERIEYDERW